MNCNRLSHWSMVAIGAVPVLGRASPGATPRLPYLLGLGLALTVCSAAYGTGTVRNYVVTRNVGAATCGAWVRVVDGLDVGAQIGPISVGTTLCPDGGIFCRTCTINKRQYSFFVKYPSRWAAFWSDTPPVPRGALASPLFSDSQDQCTASCGAPGAGILPPDFDDYSEDGVSMTALMNGVGQSLLLGTLPDDSLDSFFTDRATKWATAASEFGTAASAVGSFVGEHPNGPQVQSTLDLLRTDFLAISSRYTSPSASFPDNAYGNLLADMTTLRNLVPSGMSSTSIHLAHLGELVNHIAAMDNLNHGDLLASEYIDYLGALNDHDFDDYRSFGYDLAVDKIPDVPALPGWAGVALAGLLFVAGIFVFGKRRKEPAR